MKQNIGGLKYDILSFEVTGNLKKKKNKWRQTEKKWFSISNIRYWKYETYMKYGTDRFIGDGVQSGLNHPKNIERKTITGRVAGKTAKLNS